jgi:threonine synthase
VQAHRWCCFRCGADYPVDEVRYVCDCAMAGRLELRLGLAPLSPVAGHTVRADEGSLWRYAALLPVVGADPRAGWTPLVRADRFAARFGIEELWIKDDAANPTGSLKDRDAALTVTAALELGQRVVAGASSGNAATSLAAAAEVAGLPCVVFLPSGTSADRLRRPCAHGAHVLAVDGDYDACARLSLLASDRFGWYCQTAAVNPFTTQGKKTVALEIAEQLGWHAPDVVVVPMGNGNLLAGLHHGFRDAHRLGWIARTPRLVGVQAAGAPALYLAWSQREVHAGTVDTVADAIAVGTPLDQARALHALRETGGAAALVTDTDITYAATVLAGQEGVTTEPASAAALAALPGLVSSGAIRPGERVVVVNTGDDRRRAPGAPAGPAPVRIRPDLDAVRAALADVPGIPTDDVPPALRIARLTDLTGG